MIQLLFSPLVFHISKSLHLHVCGHVRPCACVPCGHQRMTRGASLQVICILIYEIEFSLSWSSLSRLCWVASGPQGLNPCLPRRVGSGVNSRMPSFWIWVLETKQILMLTKQALYQLNYFPNPGPIFCYVLWILSRNNVCTVVRSQYVWLIVYTCYKDQMGTAVVHVSSELCYDWSMLHLSETLPKLNF